MSEASDQAQCPLLIALTTTRRSHLAPKESDIGRRAYGQLLVYGWMNFIAPGGRVVAADVYVPAQHPPYLLLGQC